MIKDSIICVILLTGLLFGATGCEPITQEDRAFFKEQERIRNEKLATMRTASAGVSNEQVIQRVREYQAHEGDGSMQHWLDNELAGMGGEVLFPLWFTKRRGSNIHEVTFEFMIAGAKGSMTRYQFSWDVDVMDMTVKKPKLRELEEVETVDETILKQHLRRVQKHEKELE